MESRRSSETTKEQLMAAARLLFSKKGYAATSVKDIAEEAGVNISLVSYHFGGKQSLYKACLEYYTQEKIHFLETHILKPASQKDFKLRMRIFLEQVLNNEIQNPEAGCIIRRDVESEDPIIMDIFRKTILNLFDTFISFIKSGQDAGFIRKDLKPQLVAGLFMGSIQNEIRSDKIKKKFYKLSLHDSKHRAELINTALEMFFNGVEK